jgi:hypothetical protein
VRKRQWEELPARVLQRCLLTLFRTLYRWGTNSRGLARLTLTRVCVDQVAEVALALQQAVSGAMPQVSFK